MPSDEQIAQRIKFSRACACFQRQPRTGGVTPPAIGPRGRDWWFDESAGSGLFYFDYFVQETLNAFSANDDADWCNASETNASGYTVTNDENSPHYTSIITPTIYRGKDASSPAWGADANHMTTLALIRIPIPSGHPISMEIDLSCTDNGQNVFVMPFYSSWNYQTSQWDTDIDHLSGMITVPVGQTTNHYLLNLRQFPITDGYCQFFIGLQQGASNLLGQVGIMGKTILWEPD